MIERIVAASPGPDLLDVGTGAGIAALQFQAAGCAVVAVDSDPRMAEAARKSGLHVEVAKFETWDPAGRTFDAVVAGQAWHWVDPVVGAAKAAQVLRPGGRLAVFWSVFQPPADVAPALAAVCAQVAPDSTSNAWAKPALDGYSTIFSTAADGILRAAAFRESERWQFDWEKSYTRDERLDQVPTFGGAAQLSAAKRTRSVGTGPRALPRSVRLPADDRDRGCAPLAERANSRRVGRG